MAMSGHPFLSIRNAAAAYGDFIAVQDVSLDLGEGEIFGLVGLNGAGKTSLIKTIISLKDLHAGSIGLEGVPVYERESRKKIAYLPERFDPPWFLTGEEFIRFSLSLYGRKITDEEMLMAAQSVALAPEALKRRVQSYSKGMRQKLGLLGTVLTGCRLLVLDEPMSGLDPMARQQVKKIIRRCKAEGLTVFMSSHILADVREICDRVAVIHDHKMAYCGTPADMCARYGGQDMELAFLRLIGAQEAA